MTPLRVHDAELYKGAEDLQGHVQFQGAPEQRD
eukprot:CAMPEP_0194533146 /NCGR_PEP_ID=MMETSP0253-20130528/70944_1 /TAXON_ID=2966 /ORGANISM="Noctiluca scintillans" /LENGTH=32 /DNA_ID= /DNA_START= /DNA_END= /DNA_ORIENTATION=